MESVFNWLAAQPDLVQATIRVLLLVGFILTIVPGCIWWERRLLSWMQDRIGPNITGTITLPDSFPVKPLAGKKIRTFGLLQPIADGVKLFLKEDITPNTVDRFVYFIAPAVALFPAFALGATLPWAPHYGPLSLLSPVADVNVGVLYVMAISSLGVYGVVLAGYASNNKYSLLGGLRSSAQLISYELSMGMSLAAVVTAVGSLKMTEMVRYQEGPLWGVIPGLQNWFVLTPFGLVAAAIFLICMVAETNRAPFDLPEAENELIAGYHTEYSSMKFAVFFMGEYAAMLVFSGIFTAVFLGGYNPLPISWSGIAAANPGFAGLSAFTDGLVYWLGPVWFFAKVVFVFSGFIWLRATLPRLRYDQLMNLGWKSLLPLAVANFMVVGIWVLGTKLYGVWGGWLAWLCATAILVLLYITYLRASRKGLEGQLGTRSITLVDPKPRSVEMEGGQ